jgi:hypothetical protein
MRRNLELEKRRMQSGKKLPSQREISSFSVFSAKTVA